MCPGEVHSLCSLSAVVVLLTWCYVYYAAGSFTVWYVVLRGTCTVGRGFLQCRVFALLRAYCVICTMYVAACSVRVLVYSALLYVCHCSLATSLLGKVYR